MGKRKRRQPVRHAGNKLQMVAWNRPTVADNELDVELVDALVAKSQYEQSELELILEDCVFFIPIHPTTSIKRDKCVALLGEIELRICDERSVRVFDESYFYLNPISDQSLFYSESSGKHNKNKEFLYFKVDYSLGFDAMCGLKEKCRNNWLHIVYNFEGNSIKLQLHLTEKAIISLDHPCYFDREYRNASNFKKLVGSFYPVDTPVCGEFSFEVKDKIAKVYHSVSDRKVCVYHNEESENKILNQDAPADSMLKTRIPELIPELRIYQMEAVQWMLSKENANIKEINELHPLYKEFTSKDGVNLYYNYIEGFFVASKFLKLKSIPGGILADEMGLGKTIEVIGCILTNKRCDSSQSSEIDPKICEENTKVKMEVEDKILFRHKDVFGCVCGGNNSGKKYRKKLTEVKCTSCDIIQHAECVNFHSKDLSRYLCPHCCILLELTVSRATLIISPASICTQWLEELEKHVKPGVFKILLYTGVHNSGFIQPSELADNDIIICTYETLRKELDYTSLPHYNSGNGRSLRNPKRFMSIPSPLVTIEFWRICLDEAQMIECTTTKTAEMVLKLSTVNRWCVTGTPIQQSLDDLYGLILFLRVDPVYVRNYWSKLIINPFFCNILTPLLDLLRKYMWRSTKKAVIDQISIPEQTEIVHKLEFSPVELHFYQQQHRKCTNEVLQQLRQYKVFDSLVSHLDKKRMNNLLHPLRSLRQACCHPQVVRGQFVPIKKSVITMEEILQTLINKTKMAAEEAHRNLIATYNGCAGLYIIKHEYKEAVGAYRKVLQSVEEHKDTLHTDKLQRLHTLHNLAEVIDILGCSLDDIGQTIREKNLKIEAEELRADYLNKALLQVKQSQELLEKSQIALKESKFNIRYDNNWWMKALTDLHKKNNVSDLILKLKDDYNLMTSSNKFNDIFGLQYIVVTALDDLETAHIALYKAVTGLSHDPSVDTINEAVECHLRPVANSKAPKCVYCKIPKLFDRYENRLFSFHENNDTADQSVDDHTLFQNQRRGTWADSETEVILKIILSYIKQHPVLSQCVEIGTRHIKHLEGRKKEFKALRSVWMKITDYVSAIDELGMATTRLRLKYDDEPEADPPLKHVLLPSELNQQLMTLDSEQVVYTSELRRKLGQLFYLQNLEKTQCGDGQENPELCPICQKQFGKQWAILQCGHCFCTECIQTLVNEFSSGLNSKLLKCAICRNLTHHQDISYVMAKPDKASEAPDIDVKGSHSTKVEAIVRCVKKIQCDEPHAKTLIFSTWPDVLEILSQAFDQNFIQYELLQPGGKYQKALMTFKNDPSVKVLLLLIKSGSKGLNLINATHLILTEPLLNPGNEYQAVGRIHRIGQTRRTYVHKFFVKNTIEQNILNTQRNFAVHDKTKGSDDDALTLQDLKKLFTNEDLH